MTDLAAFERGLKRHLSNHVEPNRYRRVKKAPSANERAKQGYTVRLCVRDRPLPAWDHEFVYESDTISRDLAMIEAEKAARAKGWTHIAYAIDVTMRG